MDRSPSVNMGYFARHVAMQFTLDRRLIRMESEDCDYQVGGLRVFIFNVFRTVVITKFHLPDDHE